MKIYTIADTHFFHDNIITYCNRPFKSIEEQDRLLISKWNSTVTDNDLVIHLGDIALSKKSEDLKIVLKALKGRKVLVQGNHDRRSRLWYLMSGISFVCDRFVWDKTIFTHRPMLLEHLDEYEFNVHGHIHEKVKQHYKYINVSVEQINYTPINLERLIWEKRKHNQINNIQEIDIEQSK